MKNESTVIIGIILLAIGIIFLVYNAVRYLAGWTDLPKLSTVIGLVLFMFGIILTNKKMLSAKKKKSKNLEREGKIALWVSVIITIIIMIWAFFFIIMS